ncbi:DUF7093 family protein [Natrinema salifodinae]|uniref:Uncharacterized protein n=1 Tax=Natrinema salifodinae TaxID=1202768 RepID=A0A1I0PNU5_9EURY|nr:hypothetical protein [Natrinema salifodinae]SEW16032.1 hypothetical protein SAMN05216285_2768 [Natrinema salifodinae]
MVLRCSLLGHDFGEAEVEREREERGSEVVVTVQEYEECSRCGDRNVISENTEVTSLSAGTTADPRPDEPTSEPTDAPLDPDATEETAPGTETDAEFIDADAPADDAELVDADSAESAAHATGPAANANATDAPGETADAVDADEDEIALPTDDNGEPVTDDGEILDDDDEPTGAPDRDRDHGEWPDSDDVGPPVGEDSEPAAWPDDGPGADAGSETGADTGVGIEDDIDPAAIEDDAVLLENDASTDELGAADDPAGTDARTVTAEPPTADRDEPESEAATDSGTGIERANSAPTPAESDGGPADGVPTEFYCPRCDFVANGDRASLRAGDICPDCRKGYLSERERQ